MAKRDDPLSLFRRLPAVAAGINVATEHAAKRLTRLRKKYGTPAAIADHPNRENLVHVSEVDLLRIPTQSKLPDEPPPSLWHLQPAAPTKATRASSTTGRTAAGEGQDKRAPSPPRAKKEKAPKMCMHCNKMRPAADFPQARFDVCAKCVPASKGRTDLLSRAWRGGAPGLGRR